MATTIEQQVALDEALVPSIQRLRIGRSNFRPSDIQSKESTLQVVYDVLRRSPFFRSFLVTADEPEIYMQEIWATATVHQHSIRFKMNNIKHIVDLEAFREMLHISPRVLGQSFAELPFKEEILEFLRFLGHSAQIKTLTDVNVNKIYQPWRSFAAVINKCLTGKSFGFDNLRLSEAQILWGLYHNKTSTMPFLSGKIFCIKDDILFSTIKVVSRHQNTQQYGVILPIELTIEDIRNTKAYKEYYACATGEATLKPKASARKKKGGSASSTTPPTPIATLTPTTIVVAAPRLSAAAKGKQPARATSPTDPLDVERTEAEQLKIVNDDDDDEEEISKIDEQEAIESGEGDDEEAESDGESEEEETREHEEESFDLIPRTPEDGKDDGNGEEDQGLRISEEERMHEEEEADELYHDVKSQVKAQVTRILPRIEEFVNAQREAKVLTRSSHSSRTSYDVATDLSEMELKKILIDKMEGNKSIQRSDKQENLYKALVKAYDADKTILDTYGESTILKRRREEDDDQERPSAGSDRGYKRRREGMEHASAIIPSEPATRSAGRSTTGTQSRQLFASESAFTEEPLQTTYQMEEPSHPVFETGAEDQPIVHTSQHPEWFSQPRRLPTSDRDWNKTLPAAQGNNQSWISAPTK
nr:hypothetical protein [Tanacetum cinerariifolium]